MDCDLSLCNAPVMSCWHTKSNACTASQITQTCFTYQGGKQLKRISTVLRSDEKIIQVSFDITASWF